MEPLVDAEWLAAKVGGQLWTRVETVAECGSTNADLAERARTGAPSGTVLVCDHQTSGRGRFTRVWQAPPGASVALSVLLRPPAVAPARWLWLPLLAGLAVAGGLRSAAGVDARLKWPNDVLIGGRKVCGILTERLETSAGPAVVVGMGINTRLGEADLPVPTATSLAIEGSDAAPGQVVAAVLGALEAWYGRWLAGDDLREAYASACESVGRQVRVETGPGEATEGVAVGVDADGRLVVRTATGVREFSAGDVWHLR